MFTSRTSHRIAIAASTGLAALAGGFAVGTVHAALLDRPAPATVVLAGSPAAAVTVEDPAAELVPAGGIPVAPGAAIDAAPLVVEAPTTVPATPAVAAAPAPKAAVAPVAAPAPTVAAVADGDEQVWYRNPDGYCGSTSRSNLQGRTADPTCPDNQAGTYRDPATEDRPYYVMGAEGYCSGMAQRDAAAAGYPDGDPRCEPRGYGSTPKPSDE
jgi:hypothetical protein